MDMPSERIMQRAVAERDTAFDGRFFYGVVTTGVFCRPSCTSRPAKAEHLRYFADSRSALAAGFRPCKRCSPIPNDGELDRLVAVARHIEQHSQETLRLVDLGRLAGLSPSHLQRRFKRLFGVSPKAYQESVRMRNFRSSLQRGEAVTNAIYEAGFGSPSRLYGEASRSIGMTPGAYRAGGRGERIGYACCESPLGPLLLAATDKGVCCVRFGASNEELHEQLQAEFPEAELVASAEAARPELRAWVEALNLHIASGGPLPELPLDMRGTAFQIMVWRFLLGVREGEVLSYSELAQRLNKPRAARAVASACAANRIGLLIPCHRVLRSDGGLGGYRWGVERKRVLLEIERARRAERS
jgi:AraC family transcriptional regulator of adaptative response/methylated-DNA-[protein]-cysteine methyltransferase